MFYHVCEHKRAHLEAIASALTEARRGDFALGFYPGEGADTGRRVVRYEVQPYGTRGYGVVERWTYADRPDLGEFGGGFVLLSDVGFLARDLLAKPRSM